MGPLERRTDLWHLLVEEQPPDICEKMAGTQAECRLGFVLYACAGCRMQACLSLVELHNPSSGVEEEKEKKLRDGQPPSVKADREEGNAP